jgi:hypothetical protein
MLLDLDNFKNIQAENEDGQVSTTDNDDNIHPGPSISRYEKAGMFTPHTLHKKQLETQSQRKLGTSVEWRKKANRLRMVHQYT